MGMTTVSIVEDFDVIKDVGARQITGLVDTFSHALLFQTAEEGLGDRVISTISTTTHTQLERVRATEALPIVAAKL